MATQNGKRTINSFGGGMNLDIDKSLLKDNQYRYAENVRTITNDGATTGALTNIEGSTVINGFSIPSGEDIIGTATIRNYGVVFTSIIETGLNQLYRVVLNDDGSINELSSGSVFKNGGIQFNLADRPVLSIVGRYEDQNNIKVYWADGINYIKVVNIAESNDVNNKLIDNSDILDIIPSAVLKSPLIASIGSGRLNSGLIQYCYQLYSPSGSETTVSPLSQMVHLTSSSIEDKSITYLGSGLGDVYGKPAGKSVKIGIEIPSDTNFKKVKLISVYYFNYSEPPVITILKEIDIESNVVNGVVYLEDGGSSAIGELTQAEFNLIGGNLFIPNYIESKDNILFAGNVKEDTWNLSEYDTRIFHFNNGSTPLTRGSVLHTGSLIDADAFVLGFQSDFDMAEAVGRLGRNHDCIHKEIYEKERYADIEYKYDLDGNLGGEGLNVKYNFINTYLIESYGNYWSNAPGEPQTTNDITKYIDARTPRIGDIKRIGLSNLTVLKSDGSESILDLSELGLPVHNGPLNYANPYISEALRSFQRDEIYRFAAVFYDSKGRRTPARWMCDIRFPAGYEKNDLWDASIFEMPSETDNNGYSSNSLLKSQELLVKPLGLSFEFKNIPNSVKKIEIVRAKRDINNKTVYAQGVVQKIGTYRLQKAISTSNNVKDITDAGIANTLRPHPVISMGTSLSVCAPVHSGLLTRTGITDANAVAFDNYNGSSDTSQSAYNTDDNSIKDFLYTSDCLSPYFYNKNFLLFVNPETSYYGNDFVIQLKNSVTNPILDIVDLIYPVSTPPVHGMNSTTWGSSYYGDLSHNRMQFTPGVNSTKFPTGMYIGADINPKSYPKDSTPSLNNTFISSGFAGTYYNNIAGVNTSKPVRFNHVIPLISDFDVLPKTATGSWSESNYRTYVSLGGFIHKPDDGAAYNHGLNGLLADLNPSDPAVLLDNFNDEFRGGFLFKYFCRYFKKKTGDDLGGTSMDLTIQNTNKYSDTTTSTISSLSTPSNTFKLFRPINDFEYSDDVNLNNVTAESHMQEIPSGKYITIGGKQYLNFTKPINHGDGAPDKWQFANAIAKSKSMGSHGSGIIMNFSDINQVPTISWIEQKRKKYHDAELYSGYEFLDKVISSGMSTFVTNFKVMNSSIYGGFSVVDRQFTEYISTGSYIDVPLNETSANGVSFGGDTFIGIFDYTITHATDPMSTLESDLRMNQTGIRANQIRNIGALIPLESSINMHLPNSKSTVASDFSFAIQKEPGVYSPGASIGSKWTYTQELPQFDYNSAYSSERTGIGYTSELLNTKPNKSFDCRIYSSEAKTNDEEYDSWATFKVANYIDVDTEYGQITKLYKFDNKLFFWQKNAFGVVSVNERALIKDNNLSSLTLGTGGILSRFDYISTLNGFKYGIIGGITDSNSSIYWYDHERAELCIFNNGLNSLSKAKGIQTILNKNKNSIITNGLNIPMIYDKKYNEVISTIYGINNTIDIE